AVCKIENTVIHFYNLINWVKYYLIDILTKRLHFFVVSVKLKTPCQENFTTNHT
ncbi:MAG: hypothetical protein RLZZ466_1351, partial [Bacteroidota bacterium]